MGYGGTILLVVILVVMVALLLLAGAGAAVYVHSTSKAAAVAEDCEDKPKPKDEFAMAAECDTPGRWSSCIPCVVPVKCRRASRIAVGSSRCSFHATRASCWPCSKPRDTSGHKRRQSRWSRRAWHKPTSRICDLRASLPLELL